MCDCACTRVFMRVGVWLCERVGGLCFPEPRWGEQALYCFLKEIYVQSSAVAQRGLITEAGNLGHGFTARVQRSKTSPSTQRSQCMMDDPHRIRTPQISAKVLSSIKSTLTAFMSLLLNVLSIKDLDVLAWRSSSHNRRDLISTFYAEFACSPCQCAVGLQFSNLAQLNRLAPLWI